MAHKASPARVGDRLRAFSPPLCGGQPLLRVGAAVVIGGIAFLGSTGSTGQSRPDRDGGVSTLEILNDGYSLYLPLIADGATLAFEHRNATSPEGAPIRVAVARQRPPDGTYEDASSWRALSDVAADPTVQGLVLERTNGEDLVIPRADFQWLLGELPADRPGTEAVIHRRP